MQISRTIVAIAFALSALFGSVGLANASLEIPHTAIEMQSDGAVTDDCCAVDHEEHHTKCHGDAQAFPRDGDQSVAASIELYDVARGDTHQDDFLAGLLDPPRA